MTTRESLRQTAATVSRALATSERDAKAPGDGPATGQNSIVRMFGRFGWALADQVLASATNFLLGLIVARTVGARDLGGFSVAYATFTLSLGAVRAIAGDLLVVRYTGVSAEEWRQGLRRSAGTALMVGTLVGAGCLVAGLIVGEPSRTILAIVGISLPFLVVQDVWRFAFFARGRGLAAFLNDSVWAVALFAGFAILRYADVSSVAWFTSTWAASGALAAIFGVFQLRVLPTGPWTAIKWLHGHRDLAPRFFAEFVVGTGVSSLVLFAVGALAGLGELGQLRAGEIALGPLNVLFLGAGLVATAEGVRLLRESRKRLVVGCVWLSAAVTAGVLAWGAVVFVLPRSAGELVLRGNWDAARSLLPILIMVLIFHGTAFGALIGLRSLAAARRSLRAKCIDGTLMVLFVPTGAYLGGGRGAAAGYAISACLKSVNAWWQFSRAFREYEEQPVQTGINETATIAVAESTIDS
jgi:O-antigen/teichoic acid export membrane protein